MSILNLQYNGIPITAIGLAGLTASILAYATFSTEIGDAATSLSNTLGEATAAAETGVSSAIDTTTNTLNDVRTNVESNLPSAPDLGISSLTQSIMPGSNQGDFQSQGTVGGGKKKRYRTPRKRRASRKRRSHK